LLDHTLLLIAEFCYVVNNGYATASAQVRWLADPNVVLGAVTLLATSEVLNKFLVVIRQRIGGWHEIVDFTKHSLRNNRLFGEFRTYSVLLDEAG
jgi:hypothetical protein